jgi:hypothetical protein
MENVIPVSSQLSVQIILFMYCTFELAAFLDRVSSACVNSCFIVSFYRMLTETLHHVSRGQMHKQHFLLIKKSWE